MILINKVQIKLSDLQKRLGIAIPIDKIQKKPLFEINPAYVYKDPANGPGAVKHRQGISFPPVFRGKLPNGDDVEIRYCTTITPNTKTEGRTDTYAPRMVDFDGKAEFIADDIEKAVFFWLHTYNETSPFRVKGRPFEYSLVDDDARATAIISNLKLRTKATSHADNLNDQEMLIVAKGMRIQGVNNMDKLMVRAQLMQMASERPSEYLNKAESQVNHIQGLILDSIDKGIFVIDNAYNTKRWKWGMGAKAGEIITEMSNNVPDDKEALIQYISETPGAVNEILPIMINTTKTLNVKDNLSSALQGVDILSQFKDQPIEDQFDDRNKLPDDDSSETGLEFQESDDFSEFQTIKLPKGYAECQQFLGEMIGKKTPVLAKELNEGIMDGTITAENIHVKIEDMKTR